jgi:hypothetical protein
VYTFNAINNIHKKIIQIFLCKYKIEDN